MEKSVTLTVNSMHSNDLNSDWIQTLRFEDRRDGGFFTRKTAHLSSGAAPDIAGTSAESHYRPAPRAIKILNGELLEDILATVQSETRREKYRKESGSNRCTSRRRRRRTEARRRKTGL